MGWLAWPKESMKQEEAGGMVWQQRSAWAERSWQGLGSRGKPGNWCQEAREGECFQKEGQVQCQLRTEKYLADCPRVDVAGDLGGNRGW